MEIDSVTLSAIVTSLGGALAAYLTLRARKAESTQKNWAETHVAWLEELKNEVDQQRDRLNIQAKTLTEQTLQLGKLQSKLSDARDDLAQLHDRLSEFLTAHDLWQLWEDSAHGQHPKTRRTDDDRDRSEN